MAGIDDGAVPEACEAWHEKFVGQWPTLRGADGGPFSLRSALTFGLFARVVREMLVKAPGQSGISIGLLKGASRRLLKVVYSAIVGDVHTDDISERWHKVVYVLLAKKPRPTRNDE